MPPQNLFAKARNMLWGVLSRPIKPTLLVSVEKTRDEYTVYIITLGPTMAEVKKLKWNTSGASFYSVFGKLQKAGLVDKDDKGRMFIK